MTQILEGIILDIKSESYTGAIYGKNQAKLQMYIQPSAESQDPRTQVIEFDYLIELQNIPNRIPVTIISEIWMQKEQTPDENYYRVISGVLQIGEGANTQSYRIGPYKLPPDLTKLLET